MKSDRVQIRLDDTTRDEILKVAPEQNISMWIRLLIKKELERLKEKK
jgi:hypothetical protein